MSVNTASVLSILHSVSTASILRNGPVLMSTTLLEYWVSTKYQTKNFSLLFIAFQ